MTAVAATVSTTARTGDATAQKAECPPRGSKRRGGSKLSRIAGAAHQKSDLGHRHRAGRTGRGEPAAGNDRDAVAQRQEFIEVLRDHDDGGTVLRQIDDGALD